MKTKFYLIFIWGILLCGATLANPLDNSCNYSLRRIRQVSDNFVPDWVNSLGQGAVFRQAFQQANIPEENLAIGKKYQLLNLYEKYFGIMDSRLSYAERFKKLANAFMYETNFLLAFDKSFSFSRLKLSDLRNMLDLGSAGWPYIHLLNLFLPNTNRIVGVELNPERVADAMNQINFWNLDDKKNIITLGDMTYLDLIPEASGEFQLITMLHQFILPRITNHYDNFEENLRLFEGIQKRLADKGTFIVSTASIYWNTEFHLMDKVLALAGMTKMVVPATVFEGTKLNTAGYWESLFSDKIRGETDVIYIGWKEQVKNVTTMLENIFLIQEEFGKKVAEKLFSLKIEERNRYVGIEILLREDLQDKLWQRLNRTRPNLSDDKEWQKIARDILQLLG